MMVMARVPVHSHGTKIAAYYLCPALQVAASGRPAIAGINLTRMAPREMPL